MGDERIVNAKNRVFYSDGLGVGRNNPISLHTSSEYVYRLTGMDQIADILECGYVRPKKGKVRGGHKNEVFWSLGGEKKFYFDGYPVLEAPADMVKDEQIGAISIMNLTGIWIFDKVQNKYINRIDYFKEMYQEKNNGLINQDNGFSR